MLTGPNVFRNRLPKVLFSFEQRVMFEMGGTYLAGQSAMGLMTEYLPHPDIRQDEHTMYNSTYSI